jgi:hypothetical protein
LLRIVNQRSVLLIEQAEAAAVAQHGIEDSEDDAAIDETKDGIVAANPMVSVPSPPTTESACGVVPTSAARFNGTVAESLLGPGAAMAEESSLCVPSQREPEPELMPELETEQTCASNFSEEDSDSDDEQFEDVYSPVPGDKEDWGITAIIKQPLANDDDAEEWAATATVPLRTISAAKALVDETEFSATAESMVPAAAPAPALYDSSDDVSILIMVHTSDLDFVRPLDSCMRLTHFLPVAE